MNAYGGRFIYSRDELRDTIGIFDPIRLAIAYQQWWHTPYLGVGIAYKAERINVDTEVIASPFVMSRDKDHHNLRNIVFTERFSPDWMIGATIGVEYALSEQITLTSRAEYQKFFEAKGSSTMIDRKQGTIVRSPKPATGGDISTLMLSVGIKASL